VIPNGVDLKLYRPSARTVSASDPVVVACAARLIVGKGLDDAIRVVARPELHDVRLRIAGEGPWRRHLEHLADSLGTSARVEFVGAVHDMPTFWQNCDIALAPTNTLVESFGMTAIEAMASGRPVIVSTSGALPEVVADGQTGTVYPAGDLSSLATAIGAYARDPELRRLHGIAGRRRCEERFSVADVARRYLDVVDEVVASA
jgi:glycosyltransferase involved in cell wall biosynthesis